MTETEKNKTGPIDNYFQNTNNNNNNNNNNNGNNGGGEIIEGKSDWYGKEDDLSKVLELSKHDTVIHNQTNHDNSFNNDDEELKRAIQLSMKGKKYTQVF